MIRNLIRRWLGSAAVEAADLAAAPERIVEAAGVTLDAEEEGWRKLTGDISRNLNPLAQHRQQELAVYLWKTNPLANRLVELPLAYLLAEGVRLTAPGEEAQGWLDTFWSDPINNMDIKLAKKVRELALFGEQCWPTFVNEVSGHVRLGYLDPGQIATVVTDPDNVEQPIGVVTKRDGRHEARRYRVIVNGPESVFSERTQEIRQSFGDGEAFYFTVNDLSSSSRGHSDLLAQMDWLDGYDQALFGELDRWAFLRAFIYDVTLKGATPEEVAKRAKEIDVPRPGSVRVHNDAETWSAVTPELGSADGSTFARLFRNHILAGGTIPEHWFGGGGDVNRATAGEMGEPTFKAFSMRQRFIGYMLTEVGRYQVRQRTLALYGAEPEASTDPSEYVVSAEWPEMTSRDTTAYAAALQQVVVAAGVAIDRGLLSEQTAVTIVSVVAARLGVEIDPVAELKAARAEAAKRAEADSFPDYPEDPEEPDQVEEPTGEPAAEAA